MTDYSAAAAALEVPESLVKRSAEARAKADNLSVDELVTAWAGGGSAPAAKSAPADTAPPPPEPAPTPDLGAAEQPAPAPIPQSAAAAPAPLPTPKSGVPPVLVGARQSTTTVTAGAVGLLLLSILIAFFVPSLPQTGNGVRSSNHAFSSAAEAGQDAYLELGCASCHTQMIRAVVADANLGPVTLPDSNQVLGYRRIGPDLAAIGARIGSTGALVDLLTGDGQHPAAIGLSEDDLAQLLAYMRESQ